MPVLNIGPSHPMGMQRVPTSKNTTQNTSRNPGGKRRKSETAHTIPKKYRTVSRNMKKAYIVHKIRRNLTLLYEILGVQRILRSLNGFFGLT
jgi:hypothetical protein